MFRLGIVGHRFFPNRKTLLFVREQCCAILKRAQAEHGAVVAVSAIAEGADTLFAEAALSLDVPLEVIRPFENYADDFENESALKRYQNLQQAADKESSLDYVRRSDSAYQAAMDWIINHSDLVVVVWNGQPGSGMAGTGNAVTRVISESRPWVHVDVQNLLVTYH